MKTILKKVLTLIILISCCHFSSLAMRTDSIHFPKVGEVLSDHEFTDVRNYPKSSFKISDFRGKWLILDFWSHQCTGCIKSFPKMDKIHREFKDQIQLVMMGELYTEKKGAFDKNINWKTRRIYHRMDSLYNLDFTVAFDSVAVEMYDIGFLPMIFVINPDGVLIAKTSSINRDQISKLLHNQIPTFKRQFNLHEKISYQNELPFLTTGTMSNGGNDTSFLFRSVFKPYDYNVPYLRNSLRNSEKSGRFEVAKVPLIELYNLAYFGELNWSDRHLILGKFSDVPILEVRDSSDFIVKATQGLYTYSLIVPKDRAKKKFMMERIQADLNGYFPYEVTIEKRKMPAYLLILTDQEKFKKLKASGGKITLLNESPSFYEGFGYLNITIDNFLGGFKTALPPEDVDVPIFNKTGIDYDLDFRINADMLSFKSVNLALSEMGLRLVKGEEELTTLVIRDRPSEKIL